MGIFDKIKEAAGDNSDKMNEMADGAIDKAGDFIDDKTGGKFQGQIDQAQDFAKQKDDELLDQAKERIGAGNEFQAAEQAKDEAVQGFEGDEANPPA